MPTASAIRLQIEAMLSSRIPSALTPAPKIIRPVAATGIESVDKVLNGGLPVGAITEMMGPECSGRTSLALSFLSRMTRTGKVCAWIDVSNALHPGSAAAAGVDLSRLLWVRCGVPPTSNSAERAQNGFTLPENYLVPPPIKKGLHGGGFGPHPRGEVKGLSDALRSLLCPETMTPRCAEPQHRPRTEREVFNAHPLQPLKNNRRLVPPNKPWSRLDQAIRVTDLLLQAGGFGAVVLDMGSIAPEYASRVPLATWFRYRAAAERTQASMLLLTQHGCAKSSAELMLRFQSGDALQNETTVFIGVEYRVEVVRRRFTQPMTNIVPLRKLPQREDAATWKNLTEWTGPR